MGMSEEKTAKEVLKYLNGCRDNLLQQKIDNHARISEIEDQIHRLDGELRSLTRKDQSIGLSISQINHQMNEAQQHNFERNIISEMKKVIDKETYLKCVEAAKGST
jgi:hypothetical protein